MKELHDLLLNNAGNEKVIAMVCNFVNGQVKEADIRKLLTTSMTTFVLTIFLKKRRMKYAEVCISV